MKEPYRSVLSPRYKIHAPYGHNMCVYCGDYTTGVDHVPPMSSLNMMVNVVPEEKLPKCFIVPCCIECNSILSDVGKFTVNQRAVEIKKRLKKKYAKLLNSPDWTEDEIEEMGYGMQQYISLGQSKKESLRIRLSFRLPSNPK